MFGGVPVGMAWFHVYINLQLKISDETRVNMGIKSLQSEAKTKRGIFCYLRYSKIIVKGEVVGM